MSKKRSQPTAQPKRDKNVIEISFSEKEKARQRRANQRQSEIDSGMLGRGGAGVHVNPKGNTRRDRHKSNQELRRASFD